MELTKTIQLEFTLVFRLYVGQFGIAEMILFLTKKDSTNFLQVIHTMVSGCYRLRMVARDIFYHATWRPIKRLRDA